MRARRLAIFITLVLTIPLLVTPAAAYYFDLQEFETDKLVYEVGETVNMAARLIADFGAGGWCRLTFGFVSDQGPVFAEEYNITPSTQLRVFNSSYVLHPDHTSPGASGAQGFAIFSAEIFDTVSESDGRNIEITITRGHLTALPLSSMLVTHGTNATLLVKLASIHNHNITLGGGMIMIRIVDSEDQLVATLNETVGSDGLLEVDWHESYGSPGIYGLTIMTEADDDFLALNQTLPVTVVPEVSIVEVTEIPESIRCQSPDGTVYETVLVKAKHTDSLGAPLIGSSVRWNTSSDSGLMIHEGSGIYYSWVPIRLPPGLHSLTIIANHSDYQVASIDTPLTILPNELLVQVDIEFPDISEGGSLEFNITVSEQIEWNQMVPLKFDDNIGEISFIRTVAPAETSALFHELESTTSVGLHVLSISSASEYYCVSGETNLSITLIGYLTVEAFFNEAYYSEELRFNLTVLDSSNETVDWVLCSLLLDTEGEPFYESGLVNSSDTLVVALPPCIDPGPHNITVVVLSSYYHQVSIITHIVVWMRTNMSIVIEGCPLFSSINQPFNLMWLNHEPSSNLVQIENLYGISHDSVYLSRELSQVELGDNNLVYSLGKGLN